MAGSRCILSVKELCQAIRSLNFSGRNQVIVKSSASRYSTVTGHKSAETGSATFFCTQFQSLCNRSALPSSVMNKADFKQKTVVSTNQRNSPFGVPFQTGEHVNKNYVCPSRLNVKLPYMVILDNVIPGKTGMDCPMLPQSYTDMIAPQLNNRNCDIKDPSPGNSPSQNPPAKHAKNELKIRRKKMNRHLLKKFRKRMIFTLRKQTLMRKKKKEAVFQAHLDVIRKSSEDFDAEKFVRDELEEARKGGFSVNIFSSEVRK